jgi:cyclophilin family peptidyl-prolyl cis-trans isomerase
MKFYTLPFTAGIIGLALMSNTSGCSSAPSKNVEQRNAPAKSEALAVSSEAPAMNVDITHDTLVEVTTRFGSMKVQLYSETPGHRRNFLKLVRQGFYDDLLFHRCIKGFMIQGGDPNSKGAAQGQALGMGGPGYTIPAEFNPKFIHKRGTLCAARQGDQVNPKKESSGSQFYIVQGKTWSDPELDQLEKNISVRNPGFKYSTEQRTAYKTIGGTAQLDMDYTVFGEIVSGMDIIDSIAAQPTVRDRPIKDVTMRMKIVDPKNQSKK